MARNNVSLKLDGLSELRDTLTKFAPAESEKIADETVFTVAKRVERILFRRVQGKRTGRLGRSLYVRRKRPNRGILVAEVRGGGTAPYMLMLEFGTSKTRAQPFIVPATEELRPSLPGIYRAEFADALAKALAKRARKLR